MQTQAYRGLRHEIRPPHRKIPRPRPYARHLGGGANADFGNASFGLGEGEGGGLAFGDLFVDFGDGSHGEGRCFRQRGGRLGLWFGLCEEASL